MARSNRALERFFLCLYWYQSSNTRRGAQSQKQVSTYFFLLAFFRHVAILIASCDLNFGKSAFKKQWSHTDTMWINALKEVRFIEYFYKWCHLGCGEEAHPLPPRKSLPATEVLPGVVHCFKPCSFSLDSYIADTSGKGRGGSQLHCTMNNLEKHSSLRDS